MNFDIISLFPNFFNGPLSCGILRIALKKGIINVKLTNPRDFTQDGVVDDYQFGGGAGMVLKPEPLTKAINHVKKENSSIINFSPRGKRLNQNLIQELRKEEHLILICGRYKGIDERINLIFDSREISIGDYILSGGEIAALVLIESITRILPGALGNKDSAESDSFPGNLLEAPIYTRPNTYKKFKVPQILRSGNHANISDWRRRESIKKTLLQRPDLISEAKFTKKDLEIILEVLNDNIA